MPKKILETTLKIPQNFEKIALQNPDFHLKPPSLACKAGLQRQNHFLIFLIAQ